MTDLTKTVAPKTDQLNADDFLVDGKPRTIKITGVKMMDSKEQPIAISYEGDKNKPWKPSLGMRRVLIELWGQDAAKEADKYYPGRYVTLFRDPDVTFGKIVVGGIRISHASNIQSEKKIALTVSKAKRVEFMVKPLRDIPASASQPSAAQQPVQENKPTVTDVDDKAAKVRQAARAIIAAIQMEETEQGLIDLWDRDYKETMDEIKAISQKTYDHVKSELDKRMAELKSNQ